MTGGLASFPDRPLAQFNSALRSAEGGFNRGSDQEKE